MVVPCRVSFCMNCITMLSVMIRTASRSTSGTLRPSGVASAVRELAASAAIMAVTKPAPPEHKAPNEEGSGMQLQPLKSMIHIPAEYVFTAAPADYAAVQRCIKGRTGIQR
jgi:hypothetical protein